MADAVDGERLSGGAGEAAPAVVRGPGGVRGNEPEDSIRAVEGAVEDVGVAVRAGDHLDPFVRDVRKPRGITHDHPQLLIGLHELGEQWAADVPGRSGDNDHEGLAVRWIGTPAILRRTTHCHNGNFSTELLTEME